MIDLRNYQLDGIQSVRNVLAQNIKSVVLVAPTGSGKTVVASAIIQGAVNKNKEVLFLAHRIELISQASKKLAQFGIAHRISAPANDIRLISMAHFSEFGKSFISALSTVTVGTVQTTSRKMANIKKPDLIIIDECHLSISASYQKIVEQYPNAIVIGLTATPSRLDGRGLGEMYKSIVKLAEPQEIADMGFLVPMRFFAARVNPDLSKIKTIRGDYDQKELASEMNKPKLIGDAVSHHQRIARNRPTMVFCVSVKTAEDTANHFRQAGYKAIAVSGDSDPIERNRAIAGLADGSVEIVCNCALYIEGLDQPAISCIVLLAPTQSLPRYLQSVGRGSRPAKGKTDCIVLDHAGNCQRHGFPYDSREWTLEGQKKRSRKADDEPDINITTCKECYAIFEKKHPACPSCGWQPPKPKGRHIEQEDGELVEISKEEMIAKRKAEVKSAKTLPELIALGKQRGYQFPERWAAHQVRIRQEYRARNR